MPVLRSSKGHAFSSNRRAQVGNKDIRSSSSIRVRTKQVRRNKETSKSVKSPPADEVIEISSDSEGDSAGADSDQSDFVHNLRKQIAQLKDENAGQKRDLEKYKQTFSKGKVTLDITNVEDNFNCEICTGRMWSPYLLPDCGHTFCQSCLRGWFSTTLTKFVAEHPDYDPSQPDWRVHLRTSLMSPLLTNIPNLLATLPASKAPRPCYSCPTCRKIVSTRPVEVYALKAVVRCFASAVGEKSPQKDRTVRGSRKALADPWDCFFPLQKGMA